MRYSKGDVVEFKVGSNEKHTGQVRFVEEDYNENILYMLTVLAGGHTKFLKKE